MSSKKVSYTFSAYELLDIYRRYLEVHITEETAITPVQLEGMIMSDVRNYLSREKLVGSFTLLGHIPNLYIAEPVVITFIAHYERAISSIVRQMVIDGGYMVGCTILAGYRVIVEAIVYKGSDFTGFTDISNKKLVVDKASNTVSLRTLL